MPITATTPTAAPICSLFYVHTRFRGRPYKSSCPVQHAPRRRRRRRRRRTWHGHHYGTCSHPRGANSDLLIDYSADPLMAHETPILGIENGTVLYPRTPPPELLYSSCKGKPHVTGHPLMTERGRGRGRGRTPKQRPAHNTIHDSRDGTALLCHAWDTNT